MDSPVISPELLPSDVLLLQNLAGDIRRQVKDGAEARPCTSSKDAADEDGKAYRHSTAPPGGAHTEIVSHQATDPSASDEGVLAQLRAWNDPTHADFEPTVFSSWDLRDLSARLHPFIYRNLLLPYVGWARKVARHEVDVVMVTHLILYFATSVPSAAWLFYRFTYLHGVLHFAMQFHYMGTYTLMMHQHIHGGGVLTKQRAWARALDLLFPYLTDPLMGHTWNTYFYHHVKHHHVEGNGPDDLSSTVRYQRDSLWDFLQYVGRFFFFIWLDLPLYFLRKNRPAVALRAAGWELANYAALLALFRLRPDATLFVFLLPLGLLRLGLMVGNWGQHAFVDADEPDSDYRSSVTLIDVPVSLSATTLFILSPSASRALILSAGQEGQAHTPSTYHPPTTNSFVH